MPKHFSVDKPRISHNRKCRSTSKMIRGLMEMDDEVLNKNDLLLDSMNNLRQYKFRLRHCLNEVIRRENKLRERTKQFQSAKEELEETARDIQTLYNFKEKEDDAMLNLHSIIAIDDALVAQQQIKHIRKELDHMSPIVEETRNNSRTWVRCYSNVIIPEISDNRMSIPQIVPAKDRTCTVCLDNKADCAIVNCGHICMCQKCTSNFIVQLGNRKCPICRSEIKDIIVPTPI